MLITRFIIEIILRLENVFNDYRNVNKCDKLFENAWKYLQNFVNVYKCLKVFRMFKNAQKCLKMFINVWKGLKNKQWSETSQ